MATMKRHKDNTLRIFVEKGLIQMTYTRICDAYWNSEKFKRWVYILSSPPQIYDF